MKRFVNVPLLRSPARVSSPLSCLRRAPRTPAIIKSIPASLLSACINLRITRHLPFNAIDPCAMDIWRCKQWKTSCFTTTSRKRPMAIWITVLQRLYPYGSSSWLLFYPWVIVCNETFSLFSWKPIDSRKAARFTEHLFILSQILRMDTEIHWLGSPLILA